MNTSFINKWITLILLSYLAANPLFSEDMNILLIGNSYTFGFARDTEEFQDLFESSGIPHHIELRANGGYTFSSHINSSTLPTALAEKTWHAVTMQNQSLLPSYNYLFSSNFETSSTYTDGKTLADMVLADSPSTNLVWFQTPAYNTDNSNLITYFNNDMATMNDYNELAYDALANIYPSISKVAPAGNAFIQYYLENPNGDTLHSNDNSHHVQLGQYLIACTIFETITGRSSVGLNYGVSGGKLNATSALQMQELSTRVTGARSTAWEKYNFNFDASSNSILGELDSELSSDDLGTISANVTQADAIESESTFDVSFTLSHAPEQTVIFDVSTQGSGNLSFSSNSIAFNAGSTTLSTPLSVTIGEDSTLTSAMTNVLISGNASSDPYFTASNTTFSIQIINTQPGILVSSSNLSIDELDGSQMIEVQLASQPQGNVFLEVVDLDPNHVVTSGNTFSFSTSNWNTPQELSIGSVDNDDMLTTSGNFALSANASTEHLDDQGMSSVQVDYTLINDDFPSANLNLDSVEMTENQELNIEVSLNRQPLEDHNLTVRVTNDDKNILALDEQDFLFTTSNWNTPQTLTLTSVSDDDLDTDTVTLEFSGSNLTTFTQTVSIIDTFSDLSLRRSNQQQTILSVSDLGRTISEDQVQIILTGNATTTDLSWGDQGLVATHTANQSGTVDVRVIINQDGTEREININVDVYNPFQLFQEPVLRKGAELPIWMTLENSLDVVSSSDNQVFSVEEDLSLKALSTGNSQLNIEDDEGNTYHKDIDVLPAIQNDISLSLASFLEENFIHLISLPFYSANVQDLELNLGPTNSWKAYTYMNGRYIELNDQSSSELVAGQGVWLATADRQQLVQLKDGPQTDEYVCLDLQEGWNLIGNPFGEAITIDNLWLFDGQRSIRASATENTWSSSSLWIQGEDGYIESSSLQVAEGAWFYAQQSDLKLIMMTSDPQNSKPLSSPKRLNAQSTPPSQPSVDANSLKTTLISPESINGSTGGGGCLLKMENHRK